LETPGQELRRIFDYVGVSYDPSVLEKFADVRLSGPGDPTGQKQYDRIMRYPAQKWKDHLKSPIRKNWCRKYLDFVGESRLEEMGYNKKKLCSELNQVPAELAGVPFDLRDITHDFLYNYFEGPIFKRKLRWWLAGQPVVGHA
jgi:hypothetical protein